jgi:hypothetical protein
MLRFIGFLVLLVGAFGVGYFWGKEPTSNLEQRVKDLSRNMMDTTLGIERDLRRRQGLLDAKSKIVQAKAELFNKNTSEAVRELAGAANLLDTSTRGGRQADPNAQVREMITKIRELRLELSLGKKISSVKLDEIQKELDVLLRK